MKTSVKLHFCTAGAFLILLRAVCLSAAAPVRIIAVGDVHGGYPEFITTLQRVGLIDGNRQWIGGSTVLVQTGDVPDRGPRTRDCLDLLMELERHAGNQNGRVIPLLGNHEVMIMLGDLRYTLPEDYRSFSTAQSEKVRDQAYGEYRKFLSAHSGHRHTALPDDEAGRQKWMAEHPLGFFEYRDALGPRGVYGNWLRQHDAVAQVGDGLFMHGGLNPERSFRDIGELNSQIHSELASFDSLWQSLSDKNIIWRYMKLEEALRQVQEEGLTIQARGQVEDPDAVEKMQKLTTLQNSILLSPDSPLWYRGLALEPEEKLKSSLEAMLGRLKARYIVAAHTVRPKFEIVSRFDNRVFLIDTGMLKAYFGGRGSALEIQNGRFTAFYSDGEQKVLSPPEGGGTVLPNPRGEGREPQ